MSKTRTGLVPSLCSAIIVLWGAAGCGQQAPPAALAPEQRNPDVSFSLHNDTSPPLFLIQPAARGTSFEEHEVKRLPKLPGSPVVGVSAESVLQPAHSVPSPLAPTLGLNFDGVGVGFGSYADCCAPPDTNGDIGPNHYVETVNLDYAVFNKTTGAVLLGPVPINTLWSGFGGSCQTHNDGDPVVIYDSKADRWVVSQFAVNVNPSLQCVAVSQTPDPTGAYYRYSFSYGADFPDYPKMGVWSDAYYETFNMFNGAGTAFLGARVCAYDRSKMLTGAAATQQCFLTSTLYGGLLPADLDGANAPPAGAPNYVVGLDAPVASNLLQYWKFHVDWTTPANTTFTGPIALTVASYVTSCNTFARGDCIPQGGGGTNLESLADRAMFRLAYRNFTDHQALVFNHTIEVGSGSTLHSGVRWYELRPDASNNLSVFQQGTYAPDANWRWMGSAAQDKSGNMAIGYSVSSSTISPQIHFTGRLATDAAGTMTQGESVVINGTGSQTGGLARWGDYSMMGIDPVDDCTFWYTNEYIKASGSFNWSTRIASFKLPNCGGVPPPADFTISANPTTVSLQTGAAGTSAINTTVVGSAGTVSLAATVSPAGPTVSVSPASVAAGSGSTLNITAGSTTGTFTITVTGTEGTFVHSATVTLTVTAPAPADFTIAANPTAVSLQTGTAGTSAISTTQVGSAGTVSLAATVSPAGPTVSVSPASVAAGGGSTLNVTAGSTTGTFTITVTGTEGTLVHSATVTLTVTAPAPADFTIAANPTAVSLQTGTAGTSAISTTRVGSAGTVSLAATVSPAGPTVSVTPSSVASGSGATLNITAGSTTGTFTITVTGTEGTFVHSATVTLTVTAAPPPDYSLSASPASSSVVQGAGTSYTVTITRVNGFTGAVTFSVAGLPAGAAGTFSPNPSSTTSSALSVTTATTTPTGTYPLTITGASGALSHTASVSLVVTAPAAGNFSLALSPTSVTAKAGTPASYTVNITRTGGFAGDITFSLAGAPAGSTVTFAPNPATGASSALTVTTPATTSGATYSLTVTGVSGALSHTATGTLVKTAGCVGGDGDC